MILNLRATKKYIDSLATTISSTQNKIILAKEMLGENISYRTWHKDPVKMEEATNAELLERFSRVSDKLQSAWADIYTLSERIDNLIKSEEQESNAELSKLKAEIAEKDAKVRALFQLDEQNCELKRKLKELTGETSGDTDNS